MTRRTWEIWRDSPELRDKLTTLNSTLIANARSRVVGSVGYAISILLAPIYILLITFTVWSVSTARVRNALYGKNSNSDAFLKFVPNWLNDLRDTALLLWPVFGVFFLAMISIVVIAGGLRIWPEYLTFPSMARSLYRLRTNTFTPASATAIIIGVIIAVVSALLTFWFTR